MNIYQRILLIISAGILAILLFTTPRISDYKGTFIKEDKDHPYYERMYWHIDHRTALIRTAGTIGVTALLFFALKGIKK